MTQNTIPVRGSHVTVDVYGDPDGPAIIMIPGVMADAAAWAPVARALESWPTVAIVNRRGRLPSGPLTSDYSLEVEVEDVLTVLEQFSDVRTLFGWSFGALIALHVANERDVPHLIGYEPIMAPFGQVALPALQAADGAGDYDAIVEVALRDVTGAPHEVIDYLRSQAPVWSEMRRLSAPIFAETHAINQAGRPTVLASRAHDVDLIVGERNQGQAPYGITFADAAQIVSRAAIHVLPSQAHLAHLEAPIELAAFIDAVERDRFSVRGQGGDRG